MATPQQLRDRLDEEKSTHESIKNIRQDKKAKNKTDKPVSMEKERSHIKKVLPFVSHDYEISSSNNCIVTFGDINKSGGKLQNTYDFIRKVSISINIPQMKVKREFENDYVISLSSYYGLTSISSIIISENDDIILKANEYELFQLISLFTEGNTRESVINSLGEEITNKSFGKIIYSQSTDFVLPFDLFATKNSPVEDGYHLYKSNTFSVKVIPKQLKHIIILKNIHKGEVIDHLQTDNERLSNFIEFDDKSITTDTLISCNVTGIATILSSKAKEKFISDFLPKDKQFRMISELGSYRLTKKERKTENIVPIKIELNKEIQNVTAYIITIENMTCMDFCNGLKFDSNFIKKDKLGLIRSCVIDKIEYNSKNLFLSTIPGFPLDNNTFVVCTNPITHLRECLLSRQSNEMGINLSDRILSIDDTLVIKVYGYIPKLITFNHDPEVRKIKVK